MNLVKSSSSILRKFLIFNSVVFLILGLFTFFYLNAIQPNLVKQRVEKHTVIINNPIIDLITSPMILALPELVFLMNCIYF